jgi:preprotein translocase subunit SecG
MQIILVVVHLFLAIGLVGLILIQHGKGADMGAAFGSGASATVFGARGSASFLTRATSAFATLFFLTSMALAYYAAQGREEVSILDKLQTGGEAKTEQQSEVPVPPATPAPQAESDVPLAPVPEAATPANPEPATTAPSGTDEQVPSTAAQQSEAATSEQAASTPASTEESQTAPASEAGNKSE